MKKRNIMRLGTIAQNRVPKPSRSGMSASKSEQHRTRGTQIDCVELKRTTVFAAAFACCAIWSTASPMADVIPPPPVPIGSDAIWNGMTGVLAVLPEGSTEPNLGIPFLGLTPDRGIVTLLEADGTISDLVISFGPSLNIRSDVNEVPVDPSDPALGIDSTFTFIGSLTETGGWQDVSAFYGLPAGSALVVSDFGAEPVSEPTSLALLGASLLGLGLALHRRKLGVQRITEPFLRLMPRFGA